MHETTIAAKPAEPETSNVEMIDTSKVACASRDKPPAGSGEEGVAPDGQAFFDVPVADAKEVLAANVLEFRQLRRNSIKLVGSSLIKSLTFYLRRTPFTKKEQILVSFLNQINKEEDSEVK